MKLTPEGVAVLENDTHISRWVEQNRRLDHDRNALPLVLPLIKPGDTVVDAGAFIGDHTIAYLNAVGEHGHVLAFEPNPEAFECLQFNCPKATCYPLALGEMTGTRGLKISGNAGNSSLSSDESKVDYTVAMMELDLLRMRRLDYFKIDVEGFEVFVLQGAKATINICRPIMLIEVNHRMMKAQGVKLDDLLEMLDLLNYSFKPLYNNLKLEDQELDILCKPV